MQAFFISMHVNKFECAETTQKIKRIDTYSSHLRLTTCMVACQHTATQRKDVEKSMDKLKQLKRLANTRRNMHSREFECFDFIILKLSSINYMYCKLLPRDICHHATLRYMPLTCKAQIEFNNHVCLIVSFRSWRVLRPGEWIRYPLVSV